MAEPTAQEPDPERRLREDAEDALREAEELLDAPLTHLIGQDDLRWITEESHREATRGNVFWSLGINPESWLSVVYGGRRQKIHVAGLRRTNAGRWFVAGELPSGKRVFALIEGELLALQCVSFLAHQNGQWFVRLVRSCKRSKTLGGKGRPRSADKRRALVLELSRSGTCNARQIAQLIGESPATVRKDLERARKEPPRGV